EGYRASRTPLRMYRMMVQYAHDLTRRSGDQVYAVLTPGIYFVRRSLAWGPNVTAANRRSRGRLLAAWLFAHLPGEINQFYWFIASGVDASSVSLLVFTACALAVEILLVLALWFFPLTIARKLLRTSSSEPPSPSSPDIWLAMGCA